MLEEEMVDKELEDQLREAGTKLLELPSSVEEVLSLLDEVEGCLSRVEQSPSKSMQNALSPSMNALVASDLLRHADTDVKVSVASCVSEITRITAPDAPYNDDQMKQIFQLIVGAFEMLWDTSSRSYSRRVSILETVAKVRSCVVMLDLECDGLILLMFRHFLKTIRDTHPESVFSSMETIMSLVLEESEEISLELLSPLLNSVKKENQSVLPVARKLGEKVLENCTSKLKPYLLQAVKSMGMSPNDYSKIVASICQETSDTTEHNDDSVSGEHLADGRSYPEKTGSDKPPQVTEEPKPEAASPGEVDMVSEKSAKFVMSNGDVQNVKGDSLVIIDSPNKEESSQPAPQVTQFDPHNLDPEIAKADTMQDQPGKKKRGRKPNSSIGTPEASGHSNIDVDKETTGLLSQRKSHSKDEDNSHSEDQSINKSVLSAGPEKEDVGQVSSPTASQDEPVKVGSPHPSDTLPEKVRSKRGRPARAKKININEDTDSPVLPKEVALSEQVESDAPTLPEKSNSKRGRPAKAKNVNTNEATDHLPPSLPKEVSSSEQVDSDAPSHTLPEKVHSKRGRPARAKKGITNKDPDHCSPLLPKEASSSEQVESDAPLAADDVSKRRSKGDNKIEEKPNRRSGKKRQSDTENEEKSSSDTSDSEGKPLKKSGKKVDTSEQVESDDPLSADALSKRGPKGENNPLSADALSKRGPKGENKSEEKPNRRMGKKKQSDKENEEKSSDATSDSEEKPLKKSGKKVDTRGSNNEESSAKKQGDKAKKGKTKSIPEKELPGESSNKKTASALKSTEKSTSKNKKHLEETPKTTSTSKRKRTPAKEETSGKELGENLVGSKIKVWWPDDDMFYDGVVDSFDATKKKHKVVYTDGDEEILFLKKERWELIDDNTLPDGGQATDLPSPGASSEMPRKKKAKTNPDSESKQAKADASLKKGKDASTSKSKGEVTKSSRKSKNDGNIDNKSVEDTPKTASSSKNDSIGKSKGNTPKTGSKVKDDMPKISTKSKDATPKTGTKSRDATPKTGTKSRDDTLKAETKSEDDTDKTRTKSKNVTPKTGSKTGANGSSAKGKAGTPKVQENEGAGKGKSLESAKAQESETKSAKKRKRV